MKLIALNLLLFFAELTFADQEALPTAINEIVLTAKAETTCDVEGCSWPSCAVTNPTSYKSIAGLVTSPSNAFGASYGNAGVFVDDGTGGIFVQTKEDMGLSVGDLVHVQNGSTLCLYGTLALEGGEVTVEEEGAVDVAPPVVTFRPRQVGELEKAPPDIADVAPSSPTYCDCLEPFSATAGRVITVRGTAVADLADDDIYGYKLFLDDGAGVAQVFIDMNAAVPVADIRDTLLVEGADLCVTGLVAKFAGVGYELLPRTGDDIFKACPVHGCREPDSDDHDSHDHASHDHASHDHAPEPATEESEDHGSHDHDSHDHAEPPFEHLRRGRFAVE